MTERRRELAFFENLLCVRYGFRYSTYSFFITQFLKNEKQTSLSNFMPWKRSLRDLGALVRSCLQQHTHTCGISTPHVICQPITFHLSPVCPLNLWPTVSAALRKSSLELTWRWFSSNFTFTPDTQGYPHWRQLQTAI